MSLSINGLSQNEKSPHAAGSLICLGAKAVEKPALRRAKKWPHPRRRGHSPGRKTRIKRVSISSQSVLDQSYCFAIEILSKDLCSFWRLRRTDAVEPNGLKFPKKKAALKSAALFK